MKKMMRTPNNARMDAADNITFFFDGSSLAWLIFIAPIMVNTNPNVSNGKQPSIQSIQNNPWKLPQPMPTVAAINTPLRNAMEFNTKPVTAATIPDFLVFDFLSLGEGSLVIFDTLIVVSENNWLLWNNALFWGFVCRFLPSVFSGAETAGTIATKERSLSFNGITVLYIGLVCSDGFLLPSPIFELEVLDFKCQFHWIFKPVLWYRLFMEQPWVSSRIIMVKTILRRVNWNMHNFNGFNVMYEWNFCDNP